MTRINVVLEFDEKLLGEKWMNIDNLKLLLYSEKWCTKENLLRVISYEEIPTVSAVGCKTTFIEEA